MNNRSGETLLKTAALVQTSGHKDRAGGVGGGEQLQTEPAPIVSWDIEDNAEIDASTARTHPSDAPALILNTISPPNT